MKRLLFPAAALLLLAALLPAQTVIMGFCDPQCPVQPSAAVASQKICGKPDWCMTNPPMIHAATPYTGAATWDQGLSPEAAWVSDGSNIHVYNTVAGGANPCKVPCRLLCQTTWPIKSYVTGMAMDSQNRILYISDSTNTIYTTLVTAPCKFQIRTSCPFPLPGRDYFVTGLAHDQFPHGNHPGLLFIAVSRWNLSTPVPTPIPASTIIFVSSTNSPCNPFCKIAVPSCPPVITFGAATGITFDDCTGHILVTDSKLTGVIAYKYPCSHKFVQCCSAQPVTWYGLGLQRSAAAPGFSVSGQSTRARFPCNLQFPQSCAFTPGYSGGEPHVGNANFKLNFSKGPNPSAFTHAAMIMINWGNRCKAQTLVMPCKEKIILYPLLDSFYWAALVPTGLVAAPPCGLTAATPMPIPNNPVFCGYRFCGQWAVLNVQTMLPAGWVLTLSQQFTVTIGG